MRRLLLLPLLLAGLSAPAQPVPAGNITSPQENPPLTTRIRGLFDFDLPTIDPPGTIKLTLHPHVGDLFRRDTMRLDTGFRWAINDRLEISPEAAAYFTHGFRGNGGYGIAEVRLGAKYILPEWPRSNFETSLFVNIETPVGNPPVDLTDGLNHFAPGFLIQHHSSHNPRLTTFSGAGFDLITASDIIGTPALNQPRDHALNFTAGAIYDLGWIKWTLTTTYATTAVIGDTTDHFLHVRPGFLWYVPRKYTLNSKTQWILGLGARASWGPDGSQFSTNSRVRAEVTFRQFMDNVRSRRTAPDTK
ncbi:hypothetical protein Verru16b_02573 [Lacunisphaera limnophila]|uniref:MetA-pathway of phenol degradation n=1 Tax=Lacunisphaera limnophila TaxID=1838286 RepID=A0A1D8AX67_9BACT|nr:hypothetical protein [Lacunisphaera limnophila]AOS45492.1 hypothetical protein Verru16b_02573 [Lacunisphaera limnophila]